MIRPRKAAIAALPLLVAITVAIVVVKAAGGDGIPVDNGPLGNGGGSDGICAPVPRMQPLTDATIQVANAGQTAATVERVSLYRPHDLRLAGAVVLRTY